MPANCEGKQLLLGRVGLLNKSVWKLRIFDPCSDKFEIAVCLFESFGPKLLARSTEYAFLMELSCDFPMVNSLARASYSSFFWSRTSIHPWRHRPDQLQQIRSPSQSSHHCSARRRGNILVIRILDRVLEKPQGGNDEVNWSLGTSDRTFFSFRSAVVLAICIHRSWRSSCWCQFSQDCLSQTVFIETSFTPFYPQSGKT